MQIVKEAFFRHLETDAGYLVTVHVRESESVEEAICRIIMTTVNPRLDGCVLLAVDDARGVFYMTQFRREKEE